jgi:uroporphyrinogen-III decarboxylase
MPTRMTERERFLATLSFQRPDKIPLMTMGPRESTIAAWTRQGLPAGADWFRTLCAEVGIPYEFPQQPYVGLGVDVRMMPIFEEKVLAHRDGHYLVQDWMGNTVEISDQFDLTYLRNAKDFVTRKWHAFPVSNAEEFARMKSRYNPDTPGRFPDDLAARGRQLATRDYVSVVSISGPFWQLREWCGFEPLCMLCADEPDFVEEMCTFWSDFMTTVLERIFAHHIPDRFLINEDMAYKGKSMISPAMARRFLQPAWTRWASLAREAGVPIIDVDSDGNIDELIPLWLEAGVNACSPIEVAAGCDIVTYRDRFGTRMAYSGGIDKRCMARGGADLDAEMDRIAPVVRSGGFIPGCDHGIPFDVSWANMHHFARRWAELTGWL